MARDQLIGFLVTGAAVLFICGPFFISRFFPRLRFPDRWLLPGKLIHDYGTIDDKSTWFSIQRESLALCEKRGKFFLVFRSAAFMPIAWGIHQSRVELKNISVLEEALADIKQRQMESRSR